MRMLTALDILASVFRHFQCRFEEEKLSDQVSAVFVQNLKFSDEGRPGFDGG